MENVAGRLSSFDPLTGWIRCEVNFIFLAVMKLRRAESVVLRPSDDGECDQVKNFYGAVLCSHDSYAARNRVE